MNPPIILDNNRTQQGGLRSKSPQSFQPTISSTSSSWRYEQSIHSTSNGAKCLPARNASFPQSEHSILAQATAIYDWDGVIPRRRTKGITIKRGASLEICRIVNPEWCQVHDQGVCKYIPSAFLTIILIYEKRFEPYFAQLTYGKPEMSPAVARRHPFRRLFGLVTSLFCLFPSSQSDTAQGSLYDKSSMLVIPEPPFDREPYEVIQDESQITVNIGCKLIQERGVSVAFTLDLCPAVSSRFTGLTFDAILPRGYVISGISPEQQHGHPAEIQQHHSQTDWVSDTTHGVSASLPHIETTARRRDATTHSVGYTRTTKSTIRGGGVNTNHATWVATENIGNQSGLGQMKFRLLLGTQSCPPTIKYRLSFTTETKPTAQANADGANAWKGPWIEESLP